MRIRTLKPEFVTSESVSRLSREARLCFVLLLLYVDDCGRGRASPRLISSVLFPYDDDVPDRMDGWLKELEAEGMVIRYNVGADHYLEIPKWSKHQRIDKPSKSNFPPREAQASVEDHLKASNSKPAKPPKANPEPDKEAQPQEPDAIAHLHARFERLTGQQITLTPPVRQLWADWLAEGHDEADLVAVVVHIQKGIRQEKRMPGALKLSNLLNLGRFAEDLGQTRLKVRAPAVELPPPPPRTPTPPPSPPPPPKERNPDEQARIASMLASLGKRVRTTADEVNTTQEVPAS
jgi:hypothetical protein